MKRIKSILFYPILFLSLFIVGCNQTGNSSSNNIQHSHSTNSGTSVASSTNKVDSVISSDSSSITLSENPIEHIHKYEEINVSIENCETAATRYMECECGDHYSEKFVPGLDHNFGEWKVEIPPSEDEKGFQTRECSECGYVESQEIECLGHSHEYALTYTQESDCESQGYSKFECKCGYYYLDDYTPAKGHSYGEWELIDVPNEYNGGYALRHCEHNYDHFEEVFLPILNTSDYDYEVIQEPSCETGGKGAYYYEYNDKVFEFEVDISSVGSHDYGEWELTIEPTLTQEGQLTRYCKNDSSHYETKDLAMLTLGHPMYSYSVIRSANCSQEGIYEITYKIDGQKFDFEFIGEKDPYTHTFSSIFIEPKCEEAGYIYYYCECGENYEEGYYEPHGHSFLEWEVVKIPTNTASGNLIRYCEFDSSHYQEYVLPAFVEYDYVYDALTEPTCTKDGIYNYYYNEYSDLYNCVIEIYFEVEVKAYGHDIVFYEKVEPSCIQDGHYQYYYCRQCHIYATDYLLTNQVSYEALNISKLNHNYGNWEVYKEPTLTNVGELRKYCSNDNSHYAIHTLSKLNSNDYVYTLTETATCENNGKAKYEYSLDGQVFIFDIVLDTLEHNYTRYSFYDKTGHEKHCGDCGYHEEIESHNYVNGYCSYCSIHQSIELLEFSQNKLIDCDTSATYVIIPTSYQGVTIDTIYYRAFSYSKCENLTTIIIPSTIKDIDYLSFDTTVITTIYYQGTIEEWMEITIDSLAYINCEELYCYDENDEYYLVTSATVNTGSQIYNVCNIKSITNLILNKDISVLPINLEYRLETINTIYYCGTVEDWFSYDFTNNYNYISIMYYADNIFMLNEDGSFYLLVAITVPDTVTELNYQLQYMNNLKSVSFSNNIEKITSQAFMECTALDSVYYCGSADDWCKYNFEDVLNNPMIYATHFYTYEDGKYVELIDLVISDKVDCIYQYAFVSFECIDSITIEGENTIIQYNAFNDCAPSSISVPFFGSDVAGEDSIYLAYIFGCSSNNYLPESLIEVIFTGSNFNMDGLYNASYVETLKIMNPNVKGDTNINKLTSLKHFYFNGNVTQWLNNSIRLSQSAYVYFNDDSSFYLVTSIDIPESVTSIGESKFSYFSDLQTVSIAEGVNYIGDKAFAYCTNLTNVSIPSSLTSLGESLNAFEGCTLLNYYTYENGYYLGNANDKYIILISVIDKEISSFEIHEETKFIASYAIYNCDNILSITLPESVLAMGIRSLSSCDSLSEVIMYGNVNTIACTAFDDTSMSTFYYYGTIEDWFNIEFSALDNNSSLIYHIPISHNCGFKISDGEGGWTYVNDVVVPETVTEIGSIQFFAYDYLRTITLHSNITSIGEYAFLSCDNLEAIYYNATIDEFLKLKVESDFTYLIKNSSIFYLLDENGNYVLINDIISLELSEQKTSISNENYTNLVALTDLIIPASISSFENVIFSSDLVNVYYMGTIEDWKNITFSDDSSNPMNYAEYFYLLDENDEWYDATSLIVTNTD